MFALLGSLAGGLVSFVSALPRSLFWAGATALAMLVLYEGVPPFPVKIPFIGEISLIDGRVDRVRKAGDARCEEAKNLSRQHAERADSVLEQEAFLRQRRQLEEERERTLAAQQIATEHERSLDELTDEQRTCRVATPADDRRVWQ